MVQLGIGIGQARKARKVRGRQRFVSLQSTGARGRSGQLSWLKGPPAGRPPAGRYLRGKSGISQSVCHQRNYEWGLV
jgi:hypothetical protein